MYAARNVFDHTTGPAIITETDGCYWFEGHPVTNWTVTNNSFVGCNFATASAPADIYINNAVPRYARVRVREGSGAGGGWRRLPSNCPPGRAQLAAAYARAQHATPPPPPTQPHPPTHPPRRFSGGVPTTDCMMYAASPMHSAVAITDNTFWQDAGQAAVVAYAVAGVRVAGNAITRAAGTPAPGSDLVGVGCTQTTATGNTCNGGACNVSGL